MTEPTARAAAVAAGTPLLALLLCASCGVNSMATKDVRMYQSALTNNRYLGEFDEYDKTVTFGVSDLEGFKRETAALEKKK